MDHEKALLDTAPELQEDVIQALVALSRSGYLRRLREHLNKQTLNLILSHETTEGTLNVTESHKITCRVLDGFEQFADKLENE